MKQTAIDWLVDELSKYDIHNPISLSNWDILKQLSDQAKELEHKHQEELLIWVYSMFTKDAPLEYVLSEFNKLKKVK